MVLTDIVQIDRIAYDFIGGCGGQLINVDMADYDKIRADAVRVSASKMARFFFFISLFSFIVDFGFVSVMSIV